MSTQLEQDLRSRVEIVERFQDTPEYDDDGEPTGQTYRQRFLHGEVYHKGLLYVLAINVSDDTSYDDSNREYLTTAVVEHALLGT